MQTWDWSRLKDILKSFKMSFLKKFDQIKSFLSIIEKVRLFLHPSGTDASNNNKCVHSVINQAIFDALYHFQTL